MKFKDIPFLSGFFNQTPVKSSLDLDSLIVSLNEQITYKEYAIQIAINKLASALALCQFDTYEKGERKNNHYWWKFNFEPNLNTNAIDFYYQIIYEMVQNDKGALVIQLDDGQLVVADYYHLKENSLYDNEYSDIILYGGYHYDKTLYEREVLRFKFPSQKVKQIINGIYEDYAKLIQVTTNAYMRDKTMKFKLNISSMFDQRYSDMDDRDQILDDMFKNRFKSLFQPADTITPLEEGLSIDKLDIPTVTRPGTNSTSEINHLLDESINLVADAFAIPRGLLKGNVAEVRAMTDNFITFAVRPLGNEIVTEINSKLYGKYQVSQGTKLKLNTQTIQTTNVVSYANAADALIRSSVATPNELRERFGWELSDDPLLDEFKLTKNYGILEEENNNE